jgi:arginase
MADHSTDDGWDLIITPWHLDEHLPAFPIPADATQVILPPLPQGPLPARMNRLHQAAAHTVAQAATPLVLSGDCATTRAAVAPMQRRYQNLAVVWIDAHGDFNTPAITATGYLGGMALAMLTGRTPGLFDDTLGLRPVPDTSVVLADARDLDPAERDSLNASQVRRVPADPGAITSVLGELGPAPVYLHLDIDVIDGAELPGARFPSGPGPSFNQIEECLAAVRATADVVAAYVACAWLPDRIGDQTTREAITRLVGALGTTWHGPERRPPRNGARALTTLDE